jgi:hypothetical protein
VNAADKGVIAFFSLGAVGCAALLFLPVVQEGKASGGIFGALGLPNWALVGSTLVICVALVLFAFWMNSRRKRGKPPL